MQYNTSKLILYPLVMMVLVTTNSANELIKNKVMSHNEVAETGSDIYSVVSVNDTVIFVTRDAKMYTYYPASGVLKKIDAMEITALHKGTVLNDKVYIGSTDKNLYAYDPSQMDLQIAAKVNAFIWAVVPLNGKIYFSTNDQSFYEFNPDSGEVNNVPLNTTDFILTLDTFNGNIYFGGILNEPFGLKEYNPTTGQQRVVAETGDFMIFNILSTEGKIYFGSGQHLYEYTPKTEQYKAVCDAGGRSTPIQIASMNGKIYFATNMNSIYKYDPSTGTCNIVANTNGVLRSLAALNNKLYAGVERTLDEFYEVN